jgi:hypothetical protein
VTYHLVIISPWPRVRATSNVKCDGDRGCRPSFRLNGRSTDKKVKGKLEVEGGMERGWDTGGKEVAQPSGAADSGNDRAPRRIRGSVPRERGAYEVSLGHKKFAYIAKSTRLRVWSAHRPFGRGLFPVHGCKGHSPLNQVTGSRNASTRCCCQPWECASVWDTRVGTRSEGTLVSLRPSTYKGILLS